MNNPVIFSQKVRNPTMNVDDSILSCTVGLPNVANNKSSIKSVLLAEILNLGWGAFRRAVYKCVQLFSVLLLQLSCPNRFVLGWRGCTLQGTKKTSWVYFAWSYFRTPEKTKLHKSTNLQQMKHGSHLECSLNLCIDIHPCYLRKVVLCCLLISYRHTRLWSSKFGNYRLKNEMKWIRFFAKGLTSSKLLPSSDLSLHCHILRLNLVDCMRIVRFEPISFAIAFCIFTLISCHRINSHISQAQVQCMCAWVCVAIRRELRLIFESCCKKSSTSLKRMVFACSSPPPSHVWMDGGTFVRRSCYLKRGPRTGRRKKS